MLVVKRLGGAWAMGLAGLFEDKAVVGGMDVRRKFSGVFVVGRELVREVGEP